MVISLRSPGELWKAMLFVLNDQRAPRSWLSGRCLAPTLLIFALDLRQFCEKLWRSIRSFKWSFCWPVIGVALPPLQ